MSSSESSGLLRADATVAERGALIHAEKDHHDVTFMCRPMSVPRSTYYACTRRVETPTQARRRALVVEVAAEFEASRQTSGCRRIAAAPNRGGIDPRPVGAHLPHGPEQPRPHHSPGADRLTPIPTLRTYTVTPR